MCVNQRLSDKAFTQILHESLGMPLSTQNEGTDVYFRLRQPDKKHEE